MSVGGGCYKHSGQINKKIRETVRKFARFIKKSFCSPIATSFVAKQSCSSSRIVVSEKITQMKLASAKLQHQHFLPPTLMGLRSSDSGWIHPGCSPRSKMENCYQGRRGKSVEGKNWYLMSPKVEEKRSSKTGTPTYTNCIRFNFSLCPNIILNCMGF